MTHEEIDQLASAISQKVIESHALDATLRDLVTAYMKDVDRRLQLLEARTQHLPEPRYIPSGPDGFGRW